MRNANHMEDLVNSLTGKYQACERGLMSGVKKATSDDPVNEAAAAVLRGVLAEHQVPQTEVARQLGVDPAQLSRWLNAKKGPVSVRTILAVAKATGESPADIIERIDARVRASDRLIEPRSGMDI